MHALSRKKTASRPYPIGKEVVFLLNVPPLMVGMMLISWLDLFAKVNGYKAFRDFRIAYLDSIGKPKLHITPGKSLLFPHLLGKDLAVDYALDLLCSKPGMDLRRIIRGSTILPILTAFYCASQQPNFSVIRDLSQPFNLDRVIAAYDCFRGFHGIENIFCYKSDFFQKTNIFSRPEIRYCPDCVQEDSEEYGFAYARVWHNFPYVCTCAVHGSKLITFPDGIPAPGNYSITANPCTPPENHKYAAFVRDFFLYMFSTSEPIDMVSLTRPVYTLQRALRVSSWRALSSIITEGYIDSDFPGLGVRGPSDVFTDIFYEDELFNYYMYEPQNLICILIHFFGTFDNFRPFLEDKDHEPSDELLADYALRHNSDYSYKDLCSMDKEDLNRVLSERTGGNCVISHMDEGKYYVRCNVIPSCVQFRKILSSAPVPKVLAIYAENVLSDLSRKDTPMFLPVSPELLKFCPAREKRLQAEAFEDRCRQFLNRLLESDFVEKDFRFLSQSLSKMAFGLINSKEATDIFIRAAQSHPGFICIRKKTSTILSRRCQKTEEVGA